MPEYGFPLTRSLPYKNRILDAVLLRENASQKYPVFWYILRSLNILEMVYCCGYRMAVHFSECSQSCLFLNALQILIVMSSEKTNKRIRTQRLLHDLTVKNITVLTSYLKFYLLVFSYLCLIPLDVMHQIPASGKIASSITG